MNFPSKSSLLKILIMIGLLFLILNKIKIRELLITLQKANPLFLCSALLLSVIMVFLRAYKWKELLSKIPAAFLEKNISFGQSLDSILGGMAFGLITPARTGEVSRVMFLPKTIRPIATGLFIIDRGIDVIIVLVFAFVGSFQVITLKWQVLLGFTIIGSIAFFILCKTVLPRIFKPKTFPIPIKIKELLKALICGLTGLRFRDLGWNLLLGISLMSLDAISLYLLVQTFEPVTFRTIAFAFPLILLTNLVPITPGGIGVRESAAIFAFRQFQVSEATAFNSALLLYLLNSLLPSLFGILYIRKINKTK